jgi:hypothetical protein
MRSVRMSHVCNREHLQTQTCFHPVSPSHTIPDQLHGYECQLLLSHGVAQSHVCVLMHLPEPTPLTALATT